MTSDADNRMRFDNGSREKAESAVNAALNLASKGKLTVDDVKRGLDMGPLFIQTALETIKTLSAISGEARESQASVVEAVAAAQKMTAETLTELSKDMSSQESKMEIARMLHAQFMQLAQTLGTINSDNNRTFVQIAADAAKTAGAVLGIGTILALAGAGAALAASQLKKN